METKLFTARFCKAGETAQYKSEKKVKVHRRGEEYLLPANQL